MPEPPRANSSADDAADRVIAAGAWDTWTQTRTVLGVLLLVLTVAATLWMLYMLEGVILLVLLSIFLAYLIAPLVDIVHGFLVRHTPRQLASRAVAIGMTYVLLLGAFGITGYLALPSLGAQITLLGQEAPTYMDAMRTRLQAWRYFVNPDHFPQVIRDAVDTTFAHTAEAMSGTLSYGLAALLAVLSYLPWLVLIPILAFFFLKDGADLRRMALLAIPTGRLRGRGAELFQDVNDTIAAYIRAALLGCLIIGASCTVGFIAIGVPYALLLGVLATFLEFIPLVGPLVVALSATLLASFHSVGQAVVVLIFLGVLRVAQDYAIFPRLIGRGIHMHPLAVILAILCGAELAGIAGIFLAIPVVAVLSVVHRHWLDYRGSAGLVADLLKPAPPAIVVPSDEAAQASVAALRASVANPPSHPSAVDLAPLSRQP